MKYYNIIRWY